jgi:hypothetical protein
VRITKLANVTLTPVDITVDAVSSTSICVFRNANSGGVPGGYTVTASGSGAASAFTLASAGTPAPLPYSVLWNDTPGQTSGTSLTAAVTNAGHITSQTASSNCGSAPLTSASLIVQVLASDLQAVRGGHTYTGTLQIVIAPQ